MPEDNTIKFEDARIIFRNFTGRETKYNREGDRNFCVVVPDDLAVLLENDGWNIKTLKPREEGDNETPYLKVSVSFKGRPPHIVLITSRGRTDIGRDEVELLDSVDIKTVDLIVRPYSWTVGQASGISAYLKTMFITINEDDLELKYAEMDLEQLPLRGGRVEE